MEDLTIGQVEFSSGDIAARTGFFARAFGWVFVDHGPQYNAFADAGIEGAGQVARVIRQAADLDAALDAALGRVVAEGGAGTKPNFVFPVGRRFHLREPGGAETGVWSDV